MDGKDYIAYFTMEIGLIEAMPTYAGGLGILAGDTVRSAADLGIPMVVVTLLHRKGYFRQRLDAAGWQSEADAVWPVAELLEEMEPRCSIEIEGRQVLLRAWRYEVKGVGGSSVPVYFLDTDLEQNAAQDRPLTDHLYGGDLRYRLCQEAVLGIGGVRMLRALGYGGNGGSNEIRRFHMNEGHAALLTLELAYELSRQAWDMAYEQTRHTITPEMVHLVKPRCIFTTHTPVPAGQDRFPLDLVHSVITGYEGAFAEREQEFCPNAVMNMTSLALDNSHYINGVAKSHGHVAQQMFSKYDIHSITNGVHAATWACPSIARLFDEHIPGWREDNASLRYALNLSKRHIWAAHRQAKEALLAEVNRRTGMNFEPDVFTIGFARRAAVYKRADLLFWDTARLIGIAETVGPFQLVYAGKAHPQDTPGKEVIRRIHEISEVLKGKIKLVYLEDYGIDLAKLITSGVDLWLNTPQPPLEASGTSGMKAAVNGIPSFSILDGWWGEGCIEGITGWAIGGDKDASMASHDNRAEDAHALYNKLEMIILPMFCNEPDRYAELMRHSIALNASFFNTERMLSQYITKAYFK
ncbi:alpha-glucan family phosphorylase [Candidatus Ferrigenium straubiae]|jgi:starch phosphorylase|uniref:alpha-glucan family phosphorylase n=1 Tax=Candidatus Ferrigenium straubiae TaxID=2919506 RepID=UPI003F4A9257